MRKLLIVLIFAYGSVSCVPAAIIGASVNSSAKKKSRAQWSADFHKTNMEREKARLKPLDYCQEAYRFDPKWALKNKDCKTQFADAKK